MEDPDVLACGLEDAESVVCSVQCYVLRQGTCHSAFLLKPAQFFKARDVCFSVKQMTWGLML